MTPQIREFNAAAAAHSRGEEGAAERLSRAWLEMYKHATAAHEARSNDLDFIGSAPKDGSTIEIFHPEVPWSDIVRWSDEAWQSLSIPGRAYSSVSIHLLRWRPYSGDPESYLPCINTYV